MTRRKSRPRHEPSGLKLDKLVVSRLRRSEAPHGQLEAPGESPCGAAPSGSQGPLAPLVFTASGAAVSMPWPPLAAAQKGSSLSRTLGWPWATGSVWGCPSATSGHRGNGSREAGPDAGVGHAALRGWAPHTGGSRARCPQRSAPGSDRRTGKGVGRGSPGPPPRQAGRQTDGPSKIHAPLFHGHSPWPQSPGVRRPPCLWPAPVGAQGSP